MKSRLVDRVIVGADRITSSVVANKVGTYPIALAAKANGIPFYVAAPTSTFNIHDEGSVEIEERDADEVVNFGGRRIPPKGVKVFNPAFDLTPVELVTGFITEKGVIEPSQMKILLA